MTDNKERTFHILIFLFGLPGAAGASYLYGKTTDILVQTVFLACLGNGLNLFLYTREKASGKLDYDNAYHTKRYLTLYFALFIVSLVLPLLPYDIWPFALIYLSLGLFSNLACGLFAGTFFLLMTAHLAAATSVLIVFFFAAIGMLALVLFRALDEGFQVARPLAITMVFLYALIVGHHVLAEGSELTVQVLLLPLINVFSTFILTTILLNYFGRHVVRRSNDMYMEINDQEYELMTDLKERNKEAYYMAIHSAYLAERIALDLGLDARATKACAYYQSVCKELGEADGAAAFARSRNFPEGAIALIDEYTNPPAMGFVSKEAAVINICETLVRMLNSVFVRDKSAKVDYDAMIDKIFEHHWQKGDLNMNNISFGEMTRIRALLKKEKLYYDFLR